MSDYLAESRRGMENIMKNKTRLIAAVLLVGAIVPLRAADDDRKLAPVDIYVYQLDVDASTPATPALLAGVRVNGVFKGQTGWDGHLIVLVPRGWALVQAEGAGSFKPYPGHPGYAAGENVLGVNVVQSGTGVIVFLPPGHVTW